MERLKKEGIIVISTKDLVGNILYKEKYQLKSDSFSHGKPHHPNEKAWELIVPEISKKLGL